MKQALLPALLLLAGCMSPAPCPVIAYAAGSPHSSTVAVLDTLAVDPTGRTAPVACPRLEAQPYESIDQPDAEVALAERLAADPRIVAVVGHMRSRGSLVAAPVYARAGVPQIVPSATSQLLRVAGPWTFVLAPPDSIQARFLADAADSVGARRVLLFYSGEPYGEGLADAIAPYLIQRGVMVSDAVRLGVGADVATLAEAAVRRQSADLVVMLVDYAQAGAITKVVQRARPGMRMFAADGAMYAEGLRQTAGVAAESLWVVELWHPDTTKADTRRFLATFERVTGRAPTPTEALGHDAVLFAKAAIAAVGPDRDAIRGWLAGPGGASPPPGQVTGRVLHGGVESPLSLVRIGPAGAAPAPHR